MNRPARLVLLTRSILPAAGVVTLDAVTKAWAVRALAHRPRHLLDGLVTVQLVLNRGAAFGLGAAHPGWVTAAAVTGLAGVLVWALRARRPLSALAAGLTLGGATGNVLDRLGPVGAGPAHPVIDWIHLAWYPPTFNLADVALRAGLLLAALDQFHRRSRRPAAEQPAPAARASLASPPQAPVSMPGPSRRH